MNKYTQTLKRHPILFGAIGLISAYNSVCTVPNGTLGIVNTFGMVQEKVLEPGLNFKNPFSTIIPVDIKPQKITRNIPVPTKQGLAVGLNYTITYKLDRNQLANTYRNIGLDPEIVFLPLVDKSFKDVVASYNPQELYTVDRKKLLKKR